MTVHIVVKPTTTDERVRCLEWIKFTEDDNAFRFPLRAQMEEYHKDLFNLAIVKNSVKNMDRPGQFRNLKLILKEPLRGKYIDEVENFYFGECFLEEIDIKKTEDTKKKSAASQLEDILAKLNGQSKELKWSEIERKFSIGKFSGKQNASEWLKNFLTECSRHKVDDDEKKIKCLKLFLEEGALEWYKSNAIKLEDEPWKVWSESFLKVFADKGWLKVRQAYSYKYLAGSVIDYALKKERMILEIESHATDTSRINQIVVGLPFHIQDKLDREEIQTTDDLMNKLRQYEYIPKKSSGRSVTRVNTTEDEFTNVASRTKYNPGKVFEKKPCAICESKGYPGRFHPLERCRNRNKQDEKLDINLHEDCDEGLDEAKN